MKSKVYFWSFITFLVSFLIISLAGLGYSLYNIYKTQSLVAFIISTVVVGVVILGLIISGYLLAFKIQVSIQALLNTLKSIKKELESMTPGQLIKLITKVVKDLISKK